MVFYRKWIDKEGQERYTTEIEANEMHMFGSRQGTPTRALLGVFVQRLNCAIKRTFEHGGVTFDKFGRLVFQA